MEKVFCRTEEACKILGYSKWHIYRLVKQGTLPAYKPNGGILIFKVSELRSWINQGQGITNEVAMQRASTYIQC